MNVQGSREDRSKTALNTAQTNEDEEEKEKADEED
jgi:hypothetical protein